MAQIYLTITTGGLAGQRFEFGKDRITIGRRDTNDVVLAADDAKASSDHCELRFQAGSWVLADRASTNGTLVDGVEITTDTEVQTGLLFQCGDGGPIIMVGLPEEAASTAPKHHAPSVAAAPTMMADSAPVAAGEVDGPSTGRTAYYMALMTDKVQTSSKKLKFMIGVLGTLLVGVVVFAVLMAVRVDEGETKQAALESELKATGNKLEQTDKELNQTKKDLAAAEAKMKGARNQLATTSSKLADLRVAIKKAEGDAKKKLEAQAVKLEKTRQEYEKKLKAQETALNKLSENAAGGERIARAYEKSLYMLIGVDPKGQFGICTAFAIDVRGVLATNNHCLSALELLKQSGNGAVVRMNRNPQKTYRVLKWKGHPKYSRKRLWSEDVALLWVDTKGQPLDVAVKLATDEKVRKTLGAGMAIYTMGYPGKVMNERAPAADFRAAVISRLTNFANAPGDANTARVVWHSALTSKGTSGSPIFDASGEVIAVNTGGLSVRKVEVNDATTGKKRSQFVYDATGLNYGIRIDALRELF